MKLSEVKEPGFYCSPKDKKRYNIFEVYVNTSDDKEFVKNDPLLVDDWIYDYTEENGDIKYYQTHGLICRLYEFEDVEVIKLDQKYKVDGDVMWEDKPTYKKMLTMLKNQMKKDIQRYEDDEDGEYDKNDFICDIRDYLRIMGVDLN